MSNITIPKEISIKKTKAGQIGAITYIGSDDSSRKMNFNDTGLIEKYTITRGQKSYIGFYENGELKDVRSTNPVETIAINVLIKFAIYTDNALILKKKERITLSDYQK